MPGYVRVVDVDGDGFLDFIVTSNGCGGTIYRNDGTGHFAPSNITITNNVSTWTTSFALSSSNVSGNGLGDLLVGDLNNDGKQDVLSLQDGTVFINTSTPGNISFNVTSNFLPDSIAYGGVLVDINGDGFLDVVGSLSMSSSSTSTVPVVAYINNGSGVFTENNTVFLPSQPGVVHARDWLAADFNGDGKTDVLIMDHGWDYSPFPGARQWLLMNNGAGQLVDETGTNLYLQPTYTHQGAIGDLNGDGKPELILNNSWSVAASQEPRFWLNDGTGKFTGYNPTLK